METVRELRVLHVTAFCFLAVAVVLAELDARVRAADLSLEPVDLPGNDLALVADGSPRPEPDPAAGGIELDGVVMRPLSRAERWAEEFVRGDGRGTDLLDFALAQTHFLDSACPSPAGCDGPCNEITLTWRETTPNPDGFILTMDGEVLGPVAGLGNNQLPGLNGVAVAGARIAAGAHVFRLDELSLGASGEATLTVLDEQPFEDVSSLACIQGAVAVDGTCRIEADWTQVAPAPDLWRVRVNDARVGDAPASLPSIGIRGAGTGNQCVKLQGILADEGGTYIGCSVQSCCEIECVDPGCLGPAFLRICQLDYSNGGANRLLLFWAARDADYQSIDVIINDRLVGAVDPRFDGATLGGFSPGDWRIGLRGNCGPGGSAPDVTKQFEVRATSPHLGPVAGEITCVLDTETSSARLSWTNADPSSFILVRIDRDTTDETTGFSIETTLPGRSEELVVESVTERSLIRLSFLSELPSGCYASPSFDCRPEVPPAPEDRFMIRGLCGPGTSINLATAVFGLNHLFRGGTAPPCLAACDANQDGNFNLTDMVHLLLYLFQGGPGPAGWADTNGDGIVDPSCEKLADEADCATPAASCSG